MSYLHRKHLVSYPLSRRAEIVAYYAIAMAIVIALVLFSGGAKASFQTGNDIYQDCTSSEGNRRMYCAGYIMGAIDMGQDASFCVPSAMTGRQAVDMFTQFLRETPAVRDKPADHLVIGLFKALYPCAAKPTSGRTPL